MRAARLLLASLALATGLDLKYLRPTKLQTRTHSRQQQNAAEDIIRKYLAHFSVEIDPNLFRDEKDVFILSTQDNILYIRASTGVAAVWGFNYYLKKYCKSQIEWQNTQINIPNPLPTVNETVVANDRFRYYQNVCTASYSFVWWDSRHWLEHVEWMALNGINLVLAPVAQESIWLRIYKEIGMTDEEIEEHFTGPAFLAWHRMGNVRGWGGPLPPHWHEVQRQIQDSVIDHMLQLGIVPVLPAFSGHVPTAFSRIFPNTTFHSVGKWNKMEDSYCCGLFVDPNDSLFKTIGQKFLKQVILSAGDTHIYSADPFNEVIVTSWSTSLVNATAQAIFEILIEEDLSAVWLLQNWMFVHDPIQWPVSRVKSFLTSVPNGRMLVLDLQSEQWPQYDLYEMYYGQPFLWCMLHNFGGTLGMFGNMESINSDVYEVRKRHNSSMIGIGLTPEGINQNYIVYDLMLESAWRREPVELSSWVGEYAERRHGCTRTAGAYQYLLKSVYSFNGLNKMRGKYVITRQPSLTLRPWAWYGSRELVAAWRELLRHECAAPAYWHDAVDVARQVLQYRAEQFYVNIIKYKFSNTWVLNATIHQFLETMDDITSILSSSRTDNFMMRGWDDMANNFGQTEEERYLYRMNMRNQITLWGPNGEITDYACKQWAEMFSSYYTPRWKAYLEALLSSVSRKEFFDRAAVQMIIRQTIEEPFMTSEIPHLDRIDTTELSWRLYRKYSVIPGLDDLPNEELPRQGGRPDARDDGDEAADPEVILLPTTPQ